MAHQDVSVVLESGYRCIAVFGAERTVTESHDGTLLEWLEASPDEAPTLVVKAGSQFGPYDVMVRVLDAEPPHTSQSAWEDVAEVSLVCAGQMALGDLEDGWGDELSLEPSQYRLRVSARGRTEGAAREGAFPEEDEATEAEAPLEHFLLEFWPAAHSAPTLVREASKFAAEIVSPPAPDYPAEREPGLQAARLVADDLRRCGLGGSLSGQLGEVSVTMEFPGSPARIYNRMKLANGWPPGNGGTLSLNDHVGAHCSFYGDPPDSDGLAPLLGMLETTVLEIDKPKRIVKSWNWRVAGPDGRPYPTNPRLLEQDSTVVMTFAKANGRGEDARTTVTIQHSGVPAEWLTTQGPLWEWSAANFARK